MSINAKTRQEVLDQSGKRHTHTVVVPIYKNKSLTEWTIQVALDLVRPHQGRVILVGIVRVPLDQSLSRGAEEAQAVRALLDTLRHRFQTEPLTIKSRIRVEHEPWRALVRVIMNERADSVVVPWASEDEDQLFAVGIDRLVNALDCNVIITYGLPHRPLQRVLMPIRGSTDATMLLETTLSLTTPTDVHITMLHAPRPGEADTTKQMYDDISRMSQGSRIFQQTLDDQEDLIPAMLEQARQHDLVVLTVAPTEPGSDTRVVGPLARRLRREKIAPMIIVKGRRPTPLDKLNEWTEAERLPATPASVLVDKWFAENTFNSQEFTDIGRLVALKEAQGLTISLGLPALNEEETVGTVISTMRQALMDQYPLLDEIVLIDSGSTDYTVEIARDLGIPVYQHSEILRQHGTYRGKGEALWKSLHVLQGDLVAWIDTDIVNIHPRFVYGILGPLLSHENIQYVKGFYRRPLKVGDTLQAGGGGRVTELVARPLINLFYPELSGVVQPLSGEYAGRRRVLERMSFYTGYGVETGLLLDLVENYGIGSIAQVDLLTRIHHNQPLGSLSRMAFAIIQVFIDHLERRQRVELLSEINRTMKIIGYEPGHFSLSEQAISDQLRPPILSLPEYRAHRQITDWQLPAQQGGTP